MANANAAALNTTITLAQAAKLIALNGQKKTYFVRGEPGIGKSSMLKDLAKHYPNHTPVYLDMTQMDIGDVQIPYMNQAQQTVSFFPNEMLGASASGVKPVIIMADEFGKAPRSVQNVILPIMLERRAGKFKMHPESIVFATSNLVSDGVGDNVQAHANNRLAHLTVRKPSNMEWMEWGVENNIHAGILVAARENPAWFASYIDSDQTDNPYIYNPRNPKSSSVAFVTPRSLEAASHTLHNRERLGDEQALFADLAGTIGVRAAADMRAQIDLLDKIPPLQSIIDNPEGAMLPRDMPVQVMLTFNLIMKIEKLTAPQIMRYMARLPQELQALFMTQVVKSQSKVAFCAANPEFTKWVGQYGAIAV